MVFDVIVALGVPLTPAIATHLYVGILTDTGSFHYSAISPKTFDIARQLVEAGVDPTTRGAHGLRQQHAGAAEAVRRGAERHRARARRAPRRDARRSRDDRGRRRHLRGHRGADQPAADGAGDPGLGVLQGAGAGRVSREPALQGRDRRGGRGQAVRRRRATRTPPAAACPAPTPRRDDRRRRGAGPPLRPGLAQEPDQPRPLA